MDFNALNSLIINTLFSLRHTAKCVWSYAIGRYVCHSVGMSTHGYPFTLTFQLHDVHISLLHDSRWHMYGLDVSYCNDIYIWLFCWVIVHCLLFTLSQSLHLHSLWLLYFLHDSVVDCRARFRRIVIVILASFYRIIVCVCNIHFCTELAFACLLPIFKQL